MSEKIPLSLTVNGETHQAFVNPGDTLLHVLRDEFRLTGTKRGCNQGICGACTVMVDGKIVRGCLSIAANCVDREITTIEGIEVNGTLSQVQQAFLESGAAQCGFCTPGMIMTAVDMIDRIPDLDEETVRAELEGNICRCTGYHDIVDSVVAAAAAAVAAK